MATTLTSLALDIAAKDSVLAARALLAPIGKFAHSFAAAESEPGNVVKVPVYTRTTAAEFASGTNDYTSAQSADVGGVNIELNKHPWNSARLLPDDVMETDAGRDWVAQTTIAKVESCAAKLASDCIKLILTGGTGGITFTGATMRKKVASARKTAIANGINPAKATLLLTSDDFSDLLEELDAAVYGTSAALIDGYIDRLLGFGRVAEVQQSITGFQGAIVADDAFGIATRIPAVQNTDDFEVSTITCPEVGPWSFQVRSTGSRSNDAKFLGAEIIYGIKILQPTKVLFVGSGASSAS